MTRLALVDPCCAAGYAPESLGQGGLGGTEATVLRVTGALSDLMEIVQYQKGRMATDRARGGVMRPLDDAFLPMAGTTFLVVNAWKVAVKLRKAHPEARILLWLHVFPGRHNRHMGRALSVAGIGIVGVSRTHAAWLRDALGAGAPPVGYVYNPIADDLAADPTPRDPDRLLFASSPHKGLAEVFSQFRAARDEIPRLRLAVADPGYLAWNTGSVPEGVTFLGALPHAALIAEMRRALCLFYPQTTFAETFGLVMAEANAVGMPVLVHRDVGANAEVVADAGQLLDGTDPAQISARLHQWRAVAPKVGTSPEFRLGAVARRWVGMLGLEGESSIALDQVA